MLGQMTLFGGDSAPPQGLSPADRVAYILERHPETRDDDKALLYYYWLYFDGLAAILDPAALEKVKGFILRATSPETVRRRRAEHQQLESSGGHLLPQPGTAAYRRARARGGAPRR